VRRWAAVLALALALAASGAEARGWSWLGVRIRDLSEQEGDEIAKRHGIREGYGVVIVEVMQGTPAQRAGMKAGDIVVFPSGSAHRLHDGSGDAPRAARERHSNGLTVATNGSADASTDAARSRKDALFGSSGAEPEAANTMSVTTGSPQFATTMPNLTPSCQGLALASTTLNGANGAVGPV